MHLTDQIWRPGQAFPILWKIRQRAYAQQSVVKNETTAFDGRLHRARFDTCSENV